MNDEIHLILAEAEGLRHLQDDECFRLGETVAKALSALNDDETERLTDLITDANINGIIQRQLEKSMSVAGLSLEESATKLIALLGPEDSCIERVRQVVRAMKAEEKAAP